MSYYYPQAVCTMKIRWEDLEDTKDTILQKDYKIQLLAKNLTVTINDYTKADTFTAEIDYKNFPFDPRCIRACGITVHVEDKKSLFKGNTKSPDFNAANLIVPGPENTIFQGFADEESIQFDSDNRIVRLEGRDFTSLLIDSPHNGDLTDTGSKIDDVIKNLLKNLPAAEKIVVENRTGAELPILSSFYADKDKLSDKKSAKKKQNYWEVITELCRQAGLINYIELDKLVISKPRALYGENKIYQFMYGKNLTSLSFTRKLGRQKGINILLRSLNLKRKEVLSVKIPLEASDAWSKAIGIPKSEQTIEKVDSDGKITTEPAPYMTFNVPNVADIKQLTTIAEGVYEEIGRQQLEGKLSTKEFCVSQGGVEFNILEIRNGTPIQIEIDQFDLDGIRRLDTEAQRTQFLIQRCYSPEVARAFARTMGKFGTTFYTKSVEFRMSSQDGLTVDLEFVNFIDTRNKLKK